MATTDFAEVQITARDTASKPYRVRCAPVTPIPGGTAFLGNGWLVGFDTAVEAAEYLRKAQRMGLHCDATRPGKNGQRAWTTRQGLLRIARGEK